MLRTLLIIAAVLGGLIMLGSVGKAPPTSRVPAVDEARLVASGRFLFLHQGRQTGEEEYALFSSPAEGYMLLSRAHIRTASGEIALAQQYRLDRGFVPISYQLGADTPSGSQVISAQIGLEGLVMEARVGSASSSGTIADASEAVILDDHLFSHYVVLVLGIEAGAIPMQFTAAAPQGLAGLPGEVGEAEIVEFVSDGQVYEGRQRSVGKGDVDVSVLTHEGVVVAVFLPGQQGVAFDSGRFPHGVSLAPEGGADNGLSQAVVERVIGVRDRAVPLEIIPDGTGVGRSSLEGSYPNDRHPYGSLVVRAVGGIESRVIVHGGP